MSCNLACGWWLLNELLTVICRKQVIPQWDKKTNEQFPCVTYDDHKGGELVFLFVWC